MSTQPKFLPIEHTHGLPSRAVTAGASTSVLFDSALVHCTGSGLKAPRPDTLPFTYVLSPGDDTHTRLDQTIRGVSLACGDGTVRLMVSLNGRMHTMDLAADQTRGVSETTGEQRDGLPLRDFTVTVSQAINPGQSVRTTVVLMAAAVSDGSLAYVALASVDAVFLSEPR